MEDKITNSKAFYDENSCFYEEYKLPPETYIGGLKAYQKKYLFIRNYILTAIFAIMAGVYCSYIFTEEDKTMPIILSVVCLGCITAIWMNVRNVRKSYKKATEQVKDDIYCLNFYEDSMTIDTIIPEEELKQMQEEDGSIPNVAQAKVNLTHGNVKAFEDDNFFLITIVKSFFYIIPKDQIKEENQEIIRRILKKHSLIK